MDVQNSVQGKNGTYTLQDIVAENKLYRIHRCMSDAGRELLAQIAHNATCNSAVSFNAFVLTRLADESNNIESVEHAENNGAFNYDLGFPEICDSFVSDGKLINIIGFRNIESIGSIVPLVKISKSNLRIDLKTSAWILGKSLKTMQFAHANRIEISNISGNNILIEPNKHYPIIFDWSKSVLHQTQVPGSVQRDEIKLVAKSVIIALGGDLDAVLDTDADIQYTNYLKLLASNGESSAELAHSNFYSVVDDLWGSGYHKFTTYKKV